MKQPKYILETKTRVRTHETLTHTDLFGVRKPNTLGVIVGFGMGGDVYLVRHDDDRTEGRYCFDEFELDSTPLAGPEEPKAFVIDTRDKRRGVNSWGARKVEVLWSQEATFDLATVAVDMESDGSGRAEAREISQAAQVCIGDESVLLDLDGIAALRAALDKAEAAWRERNNAPPIGQRIRAARRAKGLTLEDTANAMGSSIPHASALERGNKRPTTEEIAALAALFGVDAKELTG